jgi:hypothetical protein
MPLADSSGTVPIRRSLFRVAGALREAVNNGLATLTSFVADKVGLAPKHLVIEDC